MPTTAPVRDASGGAIAHSGNAVTGATQSLTGVPANSLLYAWVYLDVGTGDTAAASAVADSVGLGGGWTLIAERSKHSDGGSAQNGHISVFRAKFVAGGSINVTASASGGSVTATTQISVNVEVITGGRLQYGVPEISYESSSTGTVKLPNAGSNVAGRYSYLRGSSVDWNAAAVPTPAAGWTTRVSARPGSPNYTAWGADMVAQAAAQAAVTFTSTAPTGGTINNSIMLEHLPAFTALANAAEDGTNTVAPVAATTGTAGNEAWDVVTTSGNGAVVYSTDEAAHGTLSYKITSGGTAGTAFVQWSQLSIGRLDRIFGRCYLFVATDNAGLVFVRLRGSTTQVLRIGMDATGHIEIRNSANTVVATFTTAITNSAWVRLEFDVTPGVANGAATVNLYNTTDSTTITETQSVTSQAFGIAYVDEVSWGQSIAATSMPTYYLDDVQVNGDALPGPVGGGGPADQDVTLTGLGSASAVGQPAVTTVTAVALTGVASASAVGEPAVEPGAVEMVLESAPTLSAVGLPTITGGASDQDVELTAVDSTSAVGQPAVTPVSAVALTGVASGSAVGQPAVAPGPATVALTGLASGSAVGQPAVTTVTAVALTGLASGSAVGQPAVGPGPATVALTGVGSGSAYGQPAITVGLTVSLTGVASASVVGQPTIPPPTAVVALTGLASGSAVGQPAVAPGPATITLTSVGSASVVGQPALAGGMPAVALIGVASTSAVGLLTVVRETVDYGVRAAAHRVSMTIP